MQRTMHGIFAVRSTCAGMARRRQMKANLRMSKMSGNSGCESEYDFTLLLEGVSEIDSKSEDALYESGCDDATISVRSGRVHLAFSRRAVSLKDAVLSAIRHVREADIGATVLRVDVCDLVTQSDIARRIGRSRQLVHQYISGVRGPGSFPAPACNITDGMPLWYWCEVAYWLWQNNFIRQEEHRQAQELAVINSVLELEHQRQVEPALTNEIMDALSST